MRGQVGGYRGGEDFDLVGIEIAERADKLGWVGIRDREGRGMELDWIELFVVLKYGFGISMSIYTLEKTAGRSNPCQYTHYLILSTK